MPVRRNGLTDRYKDLIGGQRGGERQRTGLDPRIIPIQPGGITPVQQPLLPTAPAGQYGRKPTDRETRPRGGRVPEIPNIPAEPVQPIVPDSPQWTPPQMPDISGLHPNIDPGMVQNMWANLYNPQSGWQSTMPGGGYERDPLAHAEQVFNWSPEQINEVWSTLGWGTPIGLPPPPPGGGGDEIAGPITTGGYYPKPEGPINPALDGTKYAGGGVGGGISTPPTQVQPREPGGLPSYGGDMTEWLNMLKQPITADVGLGERERQQIYNQARGQIQGATRTGMEQMRGFMGGRGFRAGESGIADTAMGGVAQAGQQGLQDVSQNIAISEAQNRFAQNMALNQANLQRMGAGGQMALGGRGQDISRELGWGGLDVTQRGQDITQQLGKGQLDLGGQQLDWQKEMFGQTFPYRQEMDSLNMLMNLYGMQNQSQQYRWNPYWQGLI